MVSLKDIAAKCGVSVATVSKALNNHKDISEATKDLINQTAKEMGYYPNSFARALKTNRTYNLGVLFADEAHNGLTHDYFNKVLNSFKEEAERNGYDITFINKHVGKQHMSYYEHAKYRGVDGIVIACIDFYDPDVIELIHSDIPVVTIDHVFDNRTSVCSDNIKGIEELVNYVYQMGHRKIAYIHGADSSVTRNRVGSFYKTTGELGLNIPDYYVLSGIYRDPDSTAELTKQLLNLKDRPTCILFPDDFTAIGGISTIEQYGLSIPDDISIVGYDGILLSEFLEPKLTTVRQDTETIGRKAAEKLIAIIENPKAYIIERVVIESKIVIGNSVKKLN